MTDCGSRSWGDSAGPLQIDYEFYHDCTLAGKPLSQSLFVLGLVSWVVALIHLLGQTAGNYLSPTLGKICERLHLTYNVAGVTFLAFGNGAPDVFSSITSFLGGEDAPMIGINALLGGSMFVCTVVVGSIAILCPCELSGKVFLRDVLFHMAAVTAVSVIAARQVMTLTTSALLLLLYLLYVTTVLGSAWADQRSRSQRESAAKAAALVSTTTIAGSAPIPEGALGSSLQTAFWHTRAALGGAAAALAAAKPQPAAALPASPGAGAGSGAGAATGGYTFLILDEHGEGDDAALDAEDATITLSGGLISPAFSGTIIEDYCSRNLAAAGPALGAGAAGYRPPVSGPGPGSGGGAATPWQSMRTRPSGSNGTGSGGGGGGRGANSREARSGLLGLGLGLGGLLQQLMPGASPLRDRLLPQADEDGEGGEAVEMEAVQGSGSSSSNSSNSSSNSSGSGKGRGAHGSLGRPDTPSHATGQPQRQSSAGAAGRPQTDALLTGLYWQQWMLQRRLRRSLLSSELWSADVPLGRRLLLLLEAPFTFLRDVSIPTLQPESWSKPLAVLHPLACPLVVLLAAGRWHDRSAGMPLPVLSCLLGLAPAAAILLLTHHSRPPRSRVVASLWVLVAFAMCVTWVYLLAGELVCCLESLGRILAVPSAYLGLTVLAWGNSIGDFFSNTSLARRGLGEMAVAGCYGGPVFNILVGLALSIGYACVQLYPAPFVIRLDTSSIVSLVFLYITLGCTVAIVSLRGFRLERGTGYLLISLYVCYSVAQGGIAVGGGD